MTPSSDIEYFLVILRSNPETWPDRFQIGSYIFPRNIFYRPNVGDQQRRHGFRSSHSKQTRPVLWYAPQRQYLFWVWERSGASLLSWDCPDPALCPDLHLSVNVFSCLWQMRCWKTFEDDNKLFCIFIEKQISDATIVNIFGRNLREVGSIYSVPR